MNQYLGMGNGSPGLKSGGIPTGTCGIAFGKFFLIFPQNKPMCSLRKSVSGGLKYVETMTSLTGGFWKGIEGEFTADIFANAIQGVGIRVGCKADPKETSLYWIRFP